MNIERRNQKWMRYIVMKKFLKIKENKNRKRRVQVKVKL